MKKLKVKNLANQKELFVKMSSSTSKKNTAFNLTRIKAEYEKEDLELRNWNIFSGGGVGASIGLVACLASTVVGVPVSSPEMFVLVGGSLLFGIIAGFILY
jgi:hypothetical protein